MEPNCKCSLTGSSSADAAAAAAAAAAPLPEPARAAGARRARTLDVRPLLARGEEPFAVILETAKALGADEALHLVAGFEPRPLYTVMQALGRGHHAEQREGAWHVWFFRAQDLAGAGEPPAGGSAPLLPPVELDVRGLPPPQPMAAILTRLAELGPGAQLLVHHHREPVLLYDHLQARGFVARTVRRGENDYVVHILPAWAAAAEGT